MLEFIWTKLEFATLKTFQTNEMKFDKIINYFCSKLGKRRFLIFDCLDICRVQSMI